MSLATCCVECGRRPVKPKMMSCRKNVTSPFYCRTVRRTVARTHFAVQCCIRSSCTVHYLTALTFFCLCPSPLNYNATPPAFHKSLSNLVLTHTPLPYVHPIIQSWSHLSHDPIPRDTSTISSQHDTTNPTSSSAPGSHSSTLPSNSPDPHQALVDLSRSPTNSMLSDDF